jgi:hypothetical protein
MCGVGPFQLGEANAVCVLPNRGRRLVSIDWFNCDRTYEKRAAFDRAHLIGDTLDRNWNSIGGRTCRANWQPGTAPLISIEDIWAAHRKGGLCTYFANVSHCGR